MANSADDYWSVIIPNDDGIGTQEVSLNQFCWAVTSWGGDARGFPSLRGQQATYAYQAGTEFRPKTPDARTVTLSMFVNGLDSSNEVVNRVQFQTNLAVLRKLFWRPSTQIGLVRRWTVIDPDTGEHTQLEATASAQVVNAVEPNMTGSMRASLDVQFLLSDPFFYGQRLTSNDLISYVNAEGTFAIANPGDDVAIAGVEINFTRVSAVAGQHILTLTNHTNTQQVGHWLRYTSLETATTEVLSLFPDKSIALKSNSSDPSVTGRVEHYGYSRWFVLFPGVNEISASLSGTYDTGSHLYISFSPPYV